MITIDDFKANTKEWLIDKLADMSLKEASQTISDLYDKLHKPKYPTTYEECCNALQMPKDESYIDIDAPLSYNKVLTSFTQLLICRDAYWKIAGEEIGLDEPWEPDWKGGEQKKYCIYYGSGIIQNGSWWNYNAILAFPTEEMRDAFYENFKDLIEQCKELL